MAKCNISDSLNVAQIRSLRKVLDDDILNVSQKHLSVAIALIDIICESAKDSEGNVHPVLVETTKMRNLFDIDGEDNNVIPMR